MDFWMVHGIWFLIGMLMFPRITMLIATATPFGPLSWLSWLVWPNLLAAVLATTLYWNTNPALCLVAWLVMAAKAAGIAHRVLVVGRPDPVGSGDTDWDEARPL